RLFRPLATSTAGRRSRRYETDSWAPELDHRAMEAVGRFGAIRGHRRLELALPPRGRVSADADPCRGRAASQERFGPGGGLMTPGAAVCVPERPLTPCTGDFSDSC